MTRPPSGLAHSSVYLESSQCLQGERLARLQAMYDIASTAVAIPPEAVQSRPNSSVTSLTVDPDDPHGHLFTVPPRRQQPTLRRNLRVLSHKRPPPHPWPGHTRWLVLHHNGTGGPETGRYTTGLPARLWGCNRDRLPRGRSSRAFGQQPQPLAFGASLGSWGL